MPHQLAQHNSRFCGEGSWVGEAGVPILKDVESLMHVFIIAHGLGASSRHLRRKLKLIFPASLPQLLHCPPRRSRILEVKLSKFIIRASNMFELATNSAFPLDHSDILERTKRASERSKLQRYHDDSTKMTLRLAGSWVDGGRLSRGGHRGLSRARENTRGASGELDRVNTKQRDRSRWR
jgi:hypothetical protein